MANVEPNLLGPWYAGVDYSKPAEELSPQQCFSMSNTRIGEGGEVAQRDGFERYISTAIGAVGIQALGKHKFSSASSSVFAVAGDTFYEDVAGTWTDRTPGGVTMTDDDDAHWSLVDANGTLCGHNGKAGDTIIKWVAAAGNVAALGMGSSSITKAKYWEWWDGRLWACNTNEGNDQANYSDDTDITAWAVNDWFSIGEELTGVKSFGRRSLALHGENGITLVRTTSNSTIPYSKEGVSARGTISHRSIVNVRGADDANVQLFIREDGVYAFAGGEARKVSKPLDGVRFWANVQKDKLATDSFACVHGDRDEAWFFVPYGSGAVKANRIIIFDYTRGIWFGPYVGNGATTNFNNVGVIDRIPHAGGFDGYVLKLDDNERLNDENDGPIEAEFITAAPPPLGIDVTNRWMFALHAFDVKGYYDVTVSHFGQRTPAETVTINQGGGYDPIETAFEIQSSKIAGEALMATVATKLSGYDSAIQLKYLNTGSGETFTIRRTATMYKPKGRRTLRGSGVI
jgi:hypothetical protein